MYTCFIKDMSTKKSYVPRNWNDDDRYNDYISYHCNSEPEYVPVYKLLKEMYDEDKANLYQYDLEEEYLYKYGELLYEEVYANGFYEELYSDYYDIYSETSGAVSDVEASDNEEDRQDKNLDDNYDEAKMNDEDNDTYQSKFIYL